MTTVKSVRVSASQANRLKKTLEKRGFYYFEDLTQVTNITYRVDGDNCFLTLKYYNGRSTKRLDSLREQKVWIAIIDKLNQMKIV